MRRVRPILKPADSASIAQTDDGVPKDVTGVTAAKARTAKTRADAIIATALRILERRLRRPGAAFRSPTDVRDYLRLSLADLEREVFLALWLDAQHRLIAREDLFVGTLTQTSVYPREVVKAALRNNAAAAILAHNHPSGVSEPSMADRILTESLKRALALVDVTVVDHFIVGGDVALSFAELGLLDAWCGRSAASASSRCREGRGRFVGQEGEAFATRPPRLNLQSSSRDRRLSFGPIRLAPSRAQVGTSDLSLTVAELLGNANGGRPVGVGADAIAAHPGQCADERLATIWHVALPCGNSEPP
jgi:DNA repair protein RadC